MTLPLLTLVALLGIGFAGMGRPKTAGVLLAVTGVLGLAIGCGPVAGGLLSGLERGYSAQASGGWGRRSAIILLGGGTEKPPQNGRVETSPLVYGRLVKALELYVACKRQAGDCFILASGGDPLWHGASEAAVYGDELRKLGVAPADIVLEPKSLNTWQNAQFCAQLLESRRPEHTFLVTSGVHLRRSALYFAHFGVGVSPVRADYVSAPLSPLPLAYNFLLTDLALHEYEGILRYHIYQHLGWNVTARAPGAV